MQLPKTILVPTDFSGCGREAIKLAEGLAKKMDASLYVLHAWVTPPRDLEGGWAVPTDFHGELEASARDQLASTLQDTQREHGNAQALFYIGEPRDSILKAARDIKADLIVMGTHGRSALPRFLLGSIAESVVRRAECPVLTVRHPQDD